MEELVCDYCKQELSKIFGILFVPSNERREWNDEVSIDIKDIREHLKTFPKGQYLVCIKCFEKIRPENFERLYKHRYSAGILTPEDIKRELEWNEDDDPC